MTGLAGLRPNVVVLPNLINGLVFIKGDFRSTNGLRDRSKAPQITMTEKVTITRISLINVVEAMVASLKTWEQNCRTLAILPTNFISIFADAL